MEFPSVNPLVIKNIITERYTNEMKRVILLFYFRRIYRRIKNYRWRIHRWSISVGDVVGKLITDEICVLHRRKNSVGKTVKSCSENTGRMKQVKQNWCVFSVSKFINNFIIDKSKITDKVLMMEYFCLWARR